MEIFLIKPRGFCAGVVRAIETVKKAIRLYGAPVYVLHDIVHNRHVVRELGEMGAIFIGRIEEAPKGSRLIYSAHGVAPDVRVRAKELGLKEIDATCGLVTKIHSAILRYSKKGYHIIIIGHKKHVEVIGAAGEAPGSVTVVESKEDVAALSFANNQPLFYVMQTTFGVSEGAIIAGALKQKFSHIITLPQSSVCYATASRQNALLGLQNSVELILVVGDNASSNSNRLMELGRKMGKASYLVNDASEIREEWFVNVKRCAITAGASTPESVVQSCVLRLQELGATKIVEKVFSEEKVVFDLPV